jgi:4-hydroxybenzoate polyprenyltransferase
MDKIMIAALRLTRTIMGILCFTSIILAGAENPDGSVNFGWTILWIAVAFVAARFFKRLDDNLPHDEQPSQE